MPHLRAEIDDPENASSLIALCDSFYWLSHYINLGAIATYTTSLRRVVTELLVSSHNCWNIALLYSPAIIQWNVVSIYSHSSRISTPITSRTPPYCLYVTDMEGDDYPDIEPVFLVICCD